MIHFEKVSKRFDNGHYGVSDITLDIGKGELAFITGHSGAGKSTLLRLIALLERPTRGQLFINGRNIGRLPDKDVPTLHPGPDTYDAPLVQVQQTFLCHVGDFPGDFLHPPQYRPDLPGPPPAE